MMAFMGLVLRIILRVAVAFCRVVFNVIRGLLIRQQGWGKVAQH